MSFSVEPIKAYLTRNTEAVSQMDPYVLLKLGKQSHKTQVIQEGGRKPQWNQKFVFKAEEDNALKVTVFDEDNVTDDEVGSATINIDTFLNNQASVEKFVSLKYQKKPAGKILLRIQSLQGAKNSQINKTYTINQPQIIQEPFYRPQTQYNEYNVKLNSGNPQIPYFKNNRNTYQQSVSYIEPEKKFDNKMYTTGYVTQRNTPKVNFSFGNSQPYGFSNTYSQRF